MDRLSAELAEFNIQSSVVSGQMLECGCHPGAPGHPEGCGVQTHRFRVSTHHVLGRTKMCGNSSNLTLLHAIISIVLYSL